MLAHTITGWWRECECEKYRVRIFHFFFFHHHLRLLLLLLHIGFAANALLGVSQLCFLSCGRRKYKCKLILILVIIFRAQYFISNIRCFFATGDAAAAAAASSSLDTSSRFGFRFIFILHIALVVGLVSVSVWPFCTSNSNIYRSIYMYICRKIFAKARLTRKKRREEECEQDMKRMILWFAWHNQLM